MKSIVKEEDLFIYHINVETGAVSIIDGEVAPFDNSIEADIEELSIYNAV